MGRQPGAGHQHAGRGALNDAGANAAWLRLATLEAVEADLRGEGEAWLTAAEFERLRAMAAPLRRRQYLAGHWLLRLMAADTWGGAPADWRFETDADPRPRLRHADGRLAWASLSHSGGQVAAALASRPIGLDLELPRKPRDYLAIAGFLFAPEEVALVAAADGEDARRERFHLYWSLKEARGKRGGEGLQPSQARRVAARPCGPAAAEAWHWPLPGEGCLALAAWPGAEVSPQGLPGDAEAGAWHYHALE